MKVIKPVTITDAMLISSTAPDTSSSYAAWSAATSYAVGTVVYRPTTHHTYVCLIAGVDATLPETSALLTTPRWADAGPINRWAMFDNQVSTETTRTSPLTVVLQPGAINALALVNVSATAVNVAMTYDGDEVYSASRNLDMSEISDWYQYFFSGFDMITQAVFADIPPYESGIVTVTMTSDSTVSCGALIAGSVYDVGDTRYEPTVEILDYSVKSTDEYGNTTFVQRKYAKKMECSLLIENNRLNSVFALVSGLRATPSVWIGSDDIRMGILTVFGWYGTFSITIPYPNHSLCTLQIQGLA